ncbi:MAG: 50S ribosomal protein L17 [Proteiniphilum sp.]|nr:50S ribosomal protein L17 [Proteiniphilum sp.]
MRHNKKFNHLGRKKAHREAMLSNMASSLIMHKRIFTTVPKAKELRKYVEPLITRSKEDSTNSRREVFSLLQDKVAVTELFQSVSQKVADRPGGYTRIIKTGFRLGDNASMCFIELVDFNENMLSEGGAKKAKTRRSRRKATGDEAVAAAPKAKEVKKEEAAPKETEKAEEAPVKEAAKAEKAPVKEAEKDEEAPVKEAAKAEEAPVAEAVEPEVKEIKEDTASTEAEAKA